MKKIFVSVIKSLLKKLVISFLRLFTLFLKNEQVLKKNFLCQKSAQLVKVNSSDWMRKSLCAVLIKSDEFTFTSWALFRSEEHTSELQSRFDLVCRLMLENKI